MSGGQLSPRTPPDVTALMREYGDLTRQALLDFLPDREPRRYLYDLIGDYPRRSSRCMRPAICIASARAHGASIEQAIHSAVSIELLHNALLVVDDIQDGSVERRGRPTLHELHGIPVALNVGSTMSILSLVPLFRNVQACGPFLAQWVFERAIEVAQQCAEGQALELGWRLDNKCDVTMEDYLDMVLRKTCSYSVMYPMRIGAMIGLRAPDVPESILRYAFLIGAAFQIQDDLLNVAGDHGRYGKELLGDLLEGKRTLLTIGLLERADEREASFVRTVFHKPREQKTQAEAEQILALMKKYDCLERTRAIAQGLIGAALQAFSIDLEKLPASRDKEFLRGLSTWVVEQP
ncbi:MAG: polyprenyl synthetase family protein [Polyangiaceae bacterium]